MAATDVLRDIQISFADVEHDGYYTGGVTSFSFEKDIYSPFTTLTAIADVPSIFTRTDIAFVGLFNGGLQIHVGLCEDIKFENYYGGRRIIVKSRGCSLLLLENEPQPGIISNCTLDSLLISAQIPNIRHELGTTSCSYLYVKEKSTVWDAICIYGLRQYSTLPYIRNENEVSLTKLNAVVIDYSEAAMVSCTRLLDTSKLLSKVYMKDADNNYTFSAEYSDAEKYAVKRVKYFDLDKQWLDDEPKGLDYKLKLSRRGMMGYTFRYVGSNREDLYDKVSNSGTEADGMQISKIKMTGDFRGLVSEITCYDDPFAQLH